MGWDSAELRPAVFDGRVRLDIQVGTGMRFFFERYNLADFEAIRQRYFRSGMANPLTNDQIIGLYSYFNTLAD